MQQYIVNSLIFSGLGIVILVLAFVMFELLTPRHNLRKEILEKQNGYRWLDSAPLTITAKAHRPAYGSDGDYFSKPGVDEVFMKVYGMMHEVNPEKWPALL